MYVTDKVLKRVFCMALCIIVCLSSVCVMAESIEKLSVGEIQYFLSEGSGESEILTPVDEFLQNGKFCAKVTVNNYDLSSEIGVVLFTGLFDKETEELLAVEFAKNPAVPAGEEAELITYIDVTDFSKQTVQSVVWKSAKTLMPLGNAAPIAPTNVTVDLDKVTNSTVELYWDASVDDTDSVAFYNVYRDGEFVGKADSTQTSFRDVGIRHNTEVSYTVEAVDDAGAVSEMSTATDTVKTDDIARLWFGSASAEIAGGDTEIELYSGEHGKISGYNIEPVHIMTGEITGNDNSYTTTVKAVNEDFEYTSGKKLGINALQLGAGTSRILANIPEGEFLDSLKDEEEIKVVMNYYDYRPVSHSYAENKIIGKKVSNMLRYEYQENTFNGISGVNTENNHSWITKVLTIPTNVNKKEGYIDNKSSLYPDVFNDRNFRFDTGNAPGGSANATDGVDAMFSIGNFSTTNSIYISKIDFAKADYVPYGAVLDFDRQEETEFVQLFRRDNYNLGEIKEVTAEENGEIKKAIELDASSAYARLLRFGFSPNYLTSEDNNVIIRITYLDDQTDTTDSAGITVGYDSTDGRSSFVIRRTGTNKWITKTFEISDAAFSTNKESLQLGTAQNASGNDWYISRVEVIKK